ncbi:Regulatory protein RecX [Candidatus Rhabdochlamydia oedothoracis]|uniref:Regulatory protein RecX n=1 Tax=Candidatus Rhabdochlamydia oedothoracis TaxID=2720720 RepID=A0ABX8V8E3_9BACT|nr:MULTISPECIES: RecX family transcriptional regulator [Rhabdochlamydia]KAG6558838.1 Regulatory protein RecX [Candidatus Rhabdochlamydia sp. W815]QYF49298.1 Regulatory protein RecX [Candidatus Rhabdochlamydia oedothoracis]
MSYSEEDHVKKQAFLYLARRSFFVEELRLKLIHKRFSQEGIDKVINLCIEQGFLDDQKLIRQLVEGARLRGFGSKAIWHKLYCKVGINRSILQQIILETEKSQFEDLKRLLQKKNQPTHLLNPKQRQRLITKCLRRGYCYDEIVRCLAE